MPEPKEGQIRRAGPGKFEAFLEGEWVAITDPEDIAYYERMASRPGQTRSPYGNKYPPRPPTYDERFPWPITHKVQGLVEDDVEAMVREMDRARKAGWELDPTGNEWVKAKEPFDRTFKTRPEVEAFLKAEVIADTHEPTPTTTGTGRYPWTYKEKEAPKTPAGTFASSQEAMAHIAQLGLQGYAPVYDKASGRYRVDLAKQPMAGQLRVFTDPVTGVRYVETSPGRWDEQTRPPVSKESVATSIEQLITQALNAEDWDKALAIRDFRDAPTDAQKFQLALQFATSDVDFDTFKTAYEFFNGAGAAAGLGGLGRPAAKAPFGFFPGGQPITQADLTMGQRPVPQFPQLPGGPQFTFPQVPGGPQLPQLPGGPQFAFPSTPTTGARFGQPANVEAQLQAELDTLLRKTDEERQGGALVTAEEAARRDELIKMLQASRAGPPQFPSGVLEAAQAAQDRALINKFQPYNFGKVKIGEKEFSIESPVARYWLTLTPQAKETMLAAGFAPDESFVPPLNQFGASSVPPITAFAPGKNGGPPVAAYKQDIGGGQFGATVRYNTPEEQMALAKATQASVAAGEYGPAGLASFDTSDWEAFRKEAVKAQAAGTVEALPYTNYAGYRKFKGLGPEPHELLQQQQGQFGAQRGQFNIERLRNLKRPTKKQFSPRVRTGFG